MSHEYLHQVFLFLVEAKYVWLTIVLLIVAAWLTGRDGHASKPSDWTSGRLPISGAAGAPADVVSRGSEPLQAVAPESPFGGVR